MNNKFNIYPDYKAVAKQLLEKISETVKSNGSAKIAVSGGSTPLKIFEEWRDAKFDWTGVKIFWVDERAVPVNSEENNFGNAKRIFEKDSSFPLDILFPMNTSGENMDAQYLKVLQENDAEKLDIILLGIGEDGHTASIFPGQNELFDHPEYVGMSVNPYSQQTRITLTGKSIFEASEAIFIALGQGKKEMLEKVADSANIEQFPASYVLHKHNNVSVYTDVEF